MLGIGDYIDLISYVDDNSSPPAALPEVLQSQQQTITNVETTRLSADSEADKSEALAADIDLDALRKGIYLSL